MSTSGAVLERRSLGRRNGFDRREKNNSYTGVEKRFVVERRTNIPRRHITKSGISWWHRLFIKTKKSSVDILDFAWHVFIGGFLFAGVTYFIVMSSNNLTIFLDDHGADLVTRELLVFVKNFVLFCDLVLFVTYMWRSTITLARKIWRQ